MPLYVYRIVRPNTPANQCETFEVRQSIHEPALTRHPKTGEPVQRVLLPPMIGRGAVGDSEIAQAGFTKFKRTSDGTYERQAGKGPRRINPKGGT